MKKPNGPTTAFMSCLFFILLSEMALKLWWPISDPFGRYKQSHYPYSYFRTINPSNVTRYTEVEEGLSGISGKNRITTNNMGFRGDYLTLPKPSHEFRIVMMGGSSTECVYIDEEQAIHTILEKELKKYTSNKDQIIKVYNAGISGDRSDDHIALLVQRIVHLQPDLIILLMGINDLLAAMNNFNYLHFNHIQNQLNWKKLFQLMLTEFQIPRRIYYSFKKIRGKTNEFINMPSKSDYRLKHEKSMQVPLTLKHPRKDLTSYENNLKTIVGVTKAHKIQLVFITQQSTWNSQQDSLVSNWHWMLAIGGKRYKDDVMDKALQEYNKAMKKIASQFSIPVFDLENHLPRTLEYFYDDVHFTVKGAYQTAADLASFIVLEKNLIRL